MRYFTTIVILVIFLNAGLLFGIISGKSSSEKNIPVISLSEGDLVMRSGKGLVSSWFRKMSLHDPRFTHAGLVIKKDGKMMVMHCYQEGIHPGLKIESFENFVNPELCDAFAVYNYDLDHNQNEKLINEMLFDLQRNISFDNDFILNNGDALYCTEWVAKSVNKAAADSLYIKPSMVDDFAYYAPDNLYLNPHAHLYFQKTN